MTHGLTVVERFEKHYIKYGSDDCWPWIGMGTDKNPRFRIKKKPNRVVGARKLAWEIANSKSLPPKRIVKPTCNNWRCMNPEHFSVDTTPARKETIKRGTAQRKTKIKNLLDSYKAKGCVGCGTKELAVLEFHHRDPKKKLFELSKVHRHLKDIETEMQKCEVLCANCHRMHHYYERTGSYSLPNIGDWKLTTFKNF